MPANYLIIGNGPAGFEAARSIRARDDNGKIVILSAERHGFYSRPGLAYYLTGQLPESQLFSHPSADYQQLKITLIRGRVTDIHPSIRSVQLENGDRLGYDSLLLATGARAFQPALPGIALKGVVTLDSLDDAKRIRKYSRKARQAVVIGGGITALELVEGLIKRNVEVHYFLRSDRFWSKVFDRNESRLVERQLASLGVKIHYRTEIKEIVGRKDRVVAVVTQQGERVKCQMVGTAVGVQPRIGLAKRAGLVTQRGLLVDEYLRTSDPYIYAAGDVAEIYLPESNAYKLNSLWGMARETGRHAGANMAGDRLSFRHPVASNASLLAGIPVTIIGRVGTGDVDDDTVSIVRGDSESWQTRIDAFAVEAKYQDSHLRLIVGSTQIYGAVLLGDQTLSAPLQALIGGRINILPIRDRLLEAATDLPRLIEAYWEHCRNQKRAG